MLLRGELDPTLNELLHILSKYCTVERGKLRIFRGDLKIEQMVILILAARLLLFYFKPGFRKWRPITNVTAILSALPKEIRKKYSYLDIHIVMNKLRRKKFPIKRKSSGGVWTYYFKTPELALEAIRKAGLS